MSHGVEIAFPRSLQGRDLNPSLAEMRSQLRTDTPLGYAQRLEALNELSDALLRGASPKLAAINNVGLPFLAGFLRATNLEHLVARELPRLAALESFTPLEGRKSLRVLPKGLVGHWIAGNVPLLGMFSWAMSALLGNRNVIRLSSRQEDLVSPLLETLAECSDTGRMIAEQTMLVFFDRENRTAHETMSRHCDVRIAWGGREAVEAIQSLPCEWECETVALGPRMSMAVVDPSAASPRALQRLATDIVYFDQMACSSPQYLFLKGAAGETAFDEVLQLFTESFATQARAIVRHPLDFSETYRIQLDRTRLLLEGGQLEHDEQTQWTVAVVSDPNRAVTCVNRFLQVIPFQDFDTIHRHIPRNVQTVITLLDAQQTEQFTEGAARYGVCRFPRPGEGNHFENPWDGVPLASRLTRWVLRTDAGGENRG
jgi:hypothetical protein